MWRIKKSNKYQAAEIKPVKGVVQRIYGWTLIELLITASIMAVISLALFSAFAAGGNVYRKIQQVIKTETTLFLSLEEMERDLKNALNFSLIGFSGDSRGVFFAGMKEKEILKIGSISYYFDNAKHALCRQEIFYPKFGPADSEARAYCEPLTYIDDFKFSYGYFNVESNEYEWADIWEKDGFPEVVKIEAVFKEGSKNVELSRRIYLPLA